MTDINFEVQGLKELEQALLDLGAAVGVKVLRGAAMDAMKPTADLMKELAPKSKRQRKDYTGKAKQPGGLQKSIRRRSTIDRANKAVVVEAGAMGKQGWRAKFIEFGTAPHYLNRGAKRGTARAVSGRRFGKTANKRKMHPGSKANPFIRPAWDQTQDQVLEIFKARLQRRLYLAARRAEQKAAAK